MRRGPSSPTWRALGRPGGGGRAAVVPLRTNLDKAAEDFVAERKTTLSEKGTMPKVRGVLRAFIAFAGNLDVAMGSPAVVGDYKKLMLDRKLAPTTINDHLVVLTGFFDYCIDNQLVRMLNPARGLLIHGAHNKAESYEPFTNGELSKICAPGPYLKRMRLPDYHWGALISAFTGARAEEVASLDVKNIYPVKGIWIFDITKGKQSTRCAGCRSMTSSSSWASWITTRPSRTRGTRCSSPTWWTVRTALKRTCVGRSATTWTRRR